MRRTGGGNGRLKVTAALDAASARANRMYRSPGFRGAYMNGARAALDGLPTAACPFPTDAPGWRRTFRLAWLRGWGSVAGGEEE